MAKKTHSKPIRVDKYAKVSAVMLRDQRLAPRDKMVYVALCDYADVTGRCWPSIAALCRLSGYGKTAVHQALLMLESLGYLERIRRSSTSNLYRIYDIPMGDFMQRQSDESDSPDSGEVKPDSGYSDSPPGGDHNPPRVYVVFDSRTGALRSADDPSPDSGYKEYKEVEHIIDTWKRALPQNPPGVRTEPEKAALVYFCRKEGITPRLVNDIISMVLKSTFLQGFNETGWKPSLLWCLRNREKILSGKYTNFENRARDIEIRI